MRETPASRLTRRSLLKGAGAASTGALLAGCTGDGASDETQTPEEGASETATEATAAESTTTETGDGYAVAMSPVGTVEFDAVPENVFTVFPQYADMAVALGHGDAVNSVYVPEMSGTTMDHYHHTSTGSRSTGRDYTTP